MSCHTLRCIEIKFNKHLWLLPGFYDWALLPTSNNKSGSANIKSWKLGLRVAGVLDYRMANPFCTIRILSRECLFKLRSPCKYQKESKSLRKKCIVIRLPITRGLSHFVSVRHPLIDVLHFLLPFYYTFFANCFQI